MRTHRGWMLGGASVLALFTASTANASDAPPVDQQSATVPEVVVTAQKREQSLLKVPISVDVVTSQTLTQAGVVDMHDISTLVPSLRTMQSNGPMNQSYRIRGIGSATNIPTFEPDVALFVDGVYLPRAGLSVDDLVDLARVEVLEGPQSTLYGKNATGGVINVVTKGPSRQFEASIEGSFSGLQGAITAPVVRIAGTVSGPITDRIRARLSFVTYDQGDTYKNLDAGAPNANDMHRYSLRGELEADLWENTTLRLDASRSEVYHSRNGDPDLQYYVYPGTPGGPNAALKLDTAMKAVCPNNNSGDRVICTFSPMQTSTYSNVLSATLNSKIGGARLTAITALSDYAQNQSTADIAQVNLPIVSYHDIQKGGAFSEELRLASPTGDKLEWLVGGYFQHTGFAEGDDGRTPTFVVEADAPLIRLSASLPAKYVLGRLGDEGFLNSKTRSSYFAVFGQATYHFDDRFALTLGARGQTEQKHASIDNAYKLAGGTPYLPYPTTACAPIPGNLVGSSLTPTHVCVNSAPAGQTPVYVSLPVNGSFSHEVSMLTWNATGEYHPNKDTMLYLTVSRGGKAFGYNIGFGAAPDSERPFKDEYVYNFEGGVKASLFGGRAKVSASLFQEDYHNYQQAGFVGLQFLVDNAQRASVTGAEASGAFALAPGLTADAAVTWLDPKFEKFTGGPCAFGETSNNGAGGCSMSGKEISGIPHWRTSIGLQYQRSIRLGQLYSRLDWSWQATETSPDPRFLQPAYSLVNARIGIKTENGLDVSLWGKNIFNQTYSLGNDVSNLFGNSDAEFQRYLGRPREYGVTLRKSF